MTRVIALHDNFLALFRTQVREHQLRRETLFSRIKEEIDQEAEELGMTAQTDASRSS